MARVRKAQFSGMFYPGSTLKLEAFFKETLQGLEGLGSVPAKGAIVPHAGYAYSGRVALQTLGACRIPKHVVLIGPNHTGLGKNIALSSVDAWETPFGDVLCSEPLRRLLLEACPLIELDDTAHLNEHSLEVELPMLAYFHPKIEIAALCLSILSKPHLKMLGGALAKALKEAEGGAMIVVSSDMSHYVSEAEAKRLDSIALEPILRLDAEGLYDAVLANGLTMCGFIPATALLFALEAFRPVKAKLTAYATSAEATKNTEEVVAYAGVVFV